MTRTDDPREHGDDRELVRAALDADPAAVERLVTRLRCIPRILVVLNNRMGRLFSAEDLRDLEQETLTALWPRMRGYTGQAALETWVYGFCFNGFMNVARKLRRRGTTGSLEERDVAPRESALPSRLDYEHVHAGLERLEAREADVIRLKYFEELTFEEIGTRLTLSPNSAKTAFYRGMRRLEQLLRKRNGGGQHS